MLALAWWRVLQGCRLWAQQAVNGPLLPCWPWSCGERCGAVVNKPSRPGCMPPTRGACCAQNYDAPSWYYSGGRRSRYCQRRNGDRYDFCNGDYLYPSSPSTWCALSCLTTSAMLGRLTKNCGAAPSAHPSCGVACLRGGHAARAGDLFLLDRFNGAILNFLTFHLISPNPILRKAHMEMRCFMHTNIASHACRGGAHAGITPTWAASTSAGTTVTAGVPGYSH